MATLSEYLNALTRDRDKLAANLEIMGVDADTTETFTRLVEKVLEIALVGKSYKASSICPIPSPTFASYEEIEAEVSEEVTDSVTVSSLSATAQVEVEEA